MVVRSEVESVCVGFLYTVVVRNIPFLCTNKSSKSCLSSEWSQDSCELFGQVVCIEETIGGGGGGGGVDFGKSI